MDSQSFAAPPDSAAPLALVPYLNLQHGIRMDYPNTWTLREQGTPFTYNAWFVAPPRSPGDAFQENLSIAVQSIFDGATLDQVVGTLQAMLQNMPVHLQELQPTTLAGHPACRITVDGPLPVPMSLTGRSLIYMLVLGSKAYTINYVGQDGGGYDNTLPTVNQMLATLQFR